MDIYLRDGLSNNVEGRGPVPKTCEQLTLRGEVLDSQTTKKRCSVGLVQTDPQVPAMVRWTSVELGHKAATRMKLFRFLRLLFAWHQQKMAEVAAVLPRGRTAAPFIAASVFASSCDDGELALTADLAVEPPADITIQQVQTTLRGLEFRKSDGSTATLEFTDGESRDLLDFTSGQVFRLFTDEELPDGTYTEVRLLFDEDQADDAFVLDGNGAEQPLIIAQASYTAINLTADEDESIDEALTLTLDLRQSLSFDDAENQYELAPVLRSVRTEDAGQIGGTVSASCTTAGAVYAFQGEVEPDDIGSSIAPFLTTALSAVVPTYVVRSLPQGTYTLAVTCDAEDDDPTTDDDINFTGTQTVDLEEGEDLEQDL